MDFFFFFLNRYGIGLDDTTTTEEKLSTLFEDETTDLVDLDPTTDLDITSTLGELSLATSMVGYDEETD